MAPLIQDHSMPRSTLLPRLLIISTESAEGAVNFFRNSLIAAADIGSSPGCDCAVDQGGADHGVELGVAGVGGWLPVLLSFLFIQNP